jgi:O-antigen/teichoic acid export membrane protein
MLNKHTTINMVAQIMGFIVNFGVGFFLTPYIVAHIGVDSYGYLGLANNFISYAQIIAVALNSMAGRFITISLSKNKIVETNKYFTSVFISNVILSILLTIPIVLVLFFLNSLLNIPNNLRTDVTFLFSLLFLNFLLSLTGSVYGIAVFAKNRLYLSSIRDILSNAVRVIILITTFSLLVPKLSYIAFSILGSTGFTIIINIYYTRELLPNIRINKKYFDFLSVKQILSSGIWNSFTQLSQVISKGLNLLIANLFIGPASMGYLSVSSTIPGMTLSLFGMLSNVFAPQLIISYAKNEKESMKKQLISSIKILGFFSSIPLSIVFAYGDIFYSLWVPTQNANLLYSLTILICIGFSLALPLEGLWNIFTVVNKVKQTSIFLFFNALLIIILVLIGLYLFDDSTSKLYVIAGTESLVSLIRSLTFLPLYGAYCLNIKLITFYPVILKSALSIVFVTLLSIFLKNCFYIDSWLKLIEVVVVTILVSFLINSIILLGKQERTLLLNILVKRIKRRRT